MMELLGRITEAPHRRAGSPGERKAVERLTDELRSYGYSIECPYHNAYVSSPEFGEIVLGDVRLACMPQGHSLPSDGGIVGRLVYVSPDQRASSEIQDLKGAFVIVDGLHSWDTSAWAIRNGATGLISVSPHEVIHMGGPTGLWGTPTVETIARIPRIVAVSVTRTVGTQLKAAAERAEKVSVVSNLKSGWEKIPLLTASLNASGDEGQDFVLLSGHVDSWLKGAMDNASGVVAIVELARTLALRREHWRRGLRICFWSGHESGSYAGSTWYADTNWDELSRHCVAHVNIDSIGCKGFDNMTNAFASGPVEKLVSDAIRKETGTTVRANPFPPICDMSFFGIGIPALFGLVSAERPENIDFAIPCGWWWHTEHDTIDQIDAARLGRDTRICFDATWKLMTAEMLPLDFVETLASWKTALLGSGLDEGKPWLDLTEIGSKITCLEGALSNLYCNSDNSVDRNQALKQISRALIPIENMRTDRFAYGFHNRDLAGIRGGKNWAETSPLIADITSYVCGPAAGNPLMEAGALRAR
ncbi:M28 family peptidase, partial [Bradyrhizobium sp. UFLA05-109]